MVNLEEIKQSLNSNPYLTNDIKENLMELVTIFNNNFNNIDLTNLNERIKTLNIIKGSKFIIKNSSYYDPIKNEILINLNHSNIDYKHLLIP